MANLTPEMIEKAKAAKNAEELLAVAKENGIELTEEEAKTWFEQLNTKSGELSDDELNDVAGGGISHDVSSINICLTCGAVYPIDDICPNCNK